MSKYTLCADGVTNTRYETKEFKLKERVKENISLLGDKIILMKGTNLLSISNDARVAFRDLETFIFDNFNEPELACSRIDMVINPTQFKTIF